MVEALKVPKFKYKSPSTLEGGGVFTTSKKRSKQFLPFLPLCYTTTSGTFSPPPYAREV